MNSNNSVYLSKLNKDDSGYVEEIRPGCKAKKRLYELGLHKGAEVKVVKNDIGPIVLNIYGNKLALGRGLANHVLIKKEA